jgi:hypothetical protein
MPWNTYESNLGPAAGVYEYVYFVVASLPYHLRMGPNCHLLLPPQTCATLLLTLAAQSATSAVVASVEPWSLVGRAAAPHGPSATAPH